MTTVEAQPQALQTNDAARIQGLYQQLIDGWNRGSGAAFAAPFAEECDFVAFDGTHFKGRQEIASFQQRLFDKWLKGTRLVGRVERMRFLTSDIAVVYAIGNTMMRGEASPAPARKSVQTLVAIRTGDTWQFAAFQNTRLRVMGSSFGAILLWNMTDWFWTFLLGKER